MPESFNTPTASPVVGFNVDIRAPVRAFAGNDGQIGANKEHFDTPTASPVVGFNISPYSPKRAFD